MTVRPSFQASLFQNIVNSASGQIVFGMWHCNSTLFDRMFVLAVTASDFHQKPPIRFIFFDHLPASHQPIPLLTDVYSTH